MLKLLTSLLLFVAAVVTPNNACTNANWWSSFDKAGFSTCNSYTKYLNGLYRNNNGGSNDVIGRLEEGRCCPRPRPYYNQPTTCVAADWSKSFDRNYQWNVCPSGFFLQGLYRSGGTGWLYNIEYGKCCKPANHPYYWGHCYNQNVRSSFDNKGVSKCNNGYMMAGMYRGSCDKLYCIENFKCCQMYPTVPVLQSLTDVKTRIMDVTLMDLSYLAYYLGYGWSSGCRGQWVGEDFRRNGDSWEADKTPSFLSCSGYKSDHRLKIHYGNFKFGIKDIKYGKAVIQSLTPSVFDSGKITNAHSTTTKTRIEREVRSVRTVTHTTTSSWKAAHELGVEVSYTPSSVTGGVGAKASYKFTYESSQTTTDSTANEQYSSFKLFSEKTLDPYSTVDWQIMLSKTRSTVPYTATILVHFSAELDGFLRWGGGYNGDSTNYHYQHRGSGSRPSFPYRFGSAATPFYEALKRQSSQNQRPWMWSAMINRYSSAKPRIDSLTKETWYEFTLSGQFEDVIGQSADVQWRDSTKKRSVSMPTSEKVDPPRVFPSPPKVEIDTGDYKEKERIAIKKHLN